MKIDCTYNRRIRIFGKDEETKGFMVSVCDLETGELIENIKRIHLYLDADDINYADVTYEREDDKQETVRVKDFGEIAVSAKLRTDPTRSVIEIVKEWEGRDDRTH